MTAASVAMRWRYGCTEMQRWTVAVLLVQPFGGARWTVHGAVSTAAVAARRYGGAAP